ncbi:VOC family protein [Nocardiopsis sp. LOL_012]|uniref:VOC family protein n=1 Tax=Nocardiopsis sp. LOL_012 TaxID=3345409 RepID=UPI003A877767
MSLRLRNISIDCTDPFTLATFWSAALGHPLHPDDAPGDPQALLRLPEGTALLFLRVPEPKTTKNRLHLDVCPTPHTTRDHQVERLTTLGARLVRDHRRTDSTGWALMHDPEGNEFCVTLPSDQI